MTRKCLSTINQQKIKKGGKTPNSSVATAAVYSFIRAYAKRTQPECLWNRELSGGKMKTSFEIRMGEPRTIKMAYSAEESPRE